MGFFAKKNSGRKSAKRKAPERIEPSFESRPIAASGLTVSRDDRSVVTATSKSKSKTPPRQAAQKPNSDRRKIKPRRAAKKPKSSSFLWRFTKGGIYWSFVLGIWGTIAVLCIVGYYASKLPQTTAWTVPERPPNAKIVSVDGNLIANRGVTGGEAMLLSDMSPYIPMAVIAIEDHRFQSHFGFDPIGFTRAMLRNVMAGRLVQGGSTLTQQLAKNLFLEPKRNLERKVQELILAFWLETKFSKDEILELYLNRVYFGSGAYGVDAASRRYFGKSARDVSLAEAALLAGLLKAPSALSPARNPKAADARAQLVLAAMRREGFVTDSETARALSMQAKKAKRYWSGSEHYAADLVMKELKQVMGEVRTDVVIDTTIDIDIQKQAGKMIQEALAKDGKKLNIGQGALVSLDGTGAIRALVGGSEYADSQFNRASEAKRQPGSAFKPFVYLAALERGMTPESIRRDARVKIGQWQPENYDKKYRGPVTLNTALAKSLNTVAAQLVMETGPKTVVQTAQRLGIQSKLASNASIALGTSEVSLLELTASYAPFANGGFGVQPYIIKRVRDMEGNTLYERKTPASDQVVGPRELGMMNVMLRDVVEKGTAKRARIKGWQVAGKTGTSQNSRDALFVGYTANLITGVWFGNDDGSPTKKVTGGGLPAKTFQAFMTAAHQGVPLAELPGNYIREYAVIPTPRPGRQVGDPNRVVRRVEDLLGSRNANRQQRRVQANRGVRPNEEAAPVRRPLAEIDGDDTRRERPRTILDVLFGG